MKAILVIDEMPIKCEDCPLHYRKRQEIYRCEMTHKNIRLNNKPSWCPLKPIPNEACQRLVEGLDAIEKLKSVEVRVVRRTECSTQKKDT